MDFNSTPIERLWYGCKWLTTAIAFVLSLVFLLWSVAIFVSDRTDYTFGIAFALVSVGLTVYEKNLATTLIEEEKDRKRKLEFFDKEQNDN
jgi:hypothetical protein